MRTTLIARVARLPIAAIFITTGATLTSLGFLAQFHVSRFAADQYFITEYTFDNSYFDITFRSSRIEYINMV
jgi:hypothetical protein